MLSRPYSTRARFWGILGGGEYSIIKLARRAKSATFKLDSGVTVKKIK